MARHLRDFVSDTSPMRKRGPRIPDRVVYSAVIVWSQQNLNSRPHEPPISGLLELFRMFQITVAEGGYRDR
jgi:hypothetical protein